MAVLGQLNSPAKWSMPNSQNKQRQVKAQLQTLPSNTNIKKYIYIYVHIYVCTYIDRCQFLGVFRFCNIAWSIVSFWVRSYKQTPLLLCQGQINGHAMSMTDYPSHHCTARGRFLLWNVAFVGQTFTVCFPIYRRNIYSPGQGQLLARERSNFTSNIYLHIPLASCLKPAKLYLNTDKGKRLYFNMYWA